MKPLPLGGPLRRRRAFKTLFSVATSAALLATPFAAALAQTGEWPVRAVRLIVPFPPGGGTDAFARPMAKVLTEQTGQTFVIDNRGGAGGTLGAELAANATPDGYTFLVGAVHHAIAVSAYPKLGYDVRKDLRPVTVIAYVPNVVVVNPNNVAARNFADFQKYVTEHPDKLNYASAGTGTTHHLTVELWKMMTNSKATHVAYRGAGPATQDLLAGQVDFMFDGLASSMPHIRTGKLVPLAVTSSKRSPALPDLPTLDEAGIKGYEARTWYALWAPAATPNDIVERFARVAAKALGTEELKSAWAALGADAGGEGPAYMQKFVTDEIEKWAKVVKDAGVKIESK